MERVTRSTKTITKPAPPVGEGAGGFFTPGDPTTGTPATVPGYEFFNRIQEEIANVVVDGGLTLDPADDTQMSQAIQAMIAAGTTVQYPPGHLIGCALSNNALIPANDIDIAAGSCRDAADTMNMSRAASMTKQLNAAWAEGTNLGGLFSGAKAVSTWYHVHLIRNDVNGAIDAGFDTSATAANAPAGWSAHRRIGSIRTDAAGNILVFHQDGDHFVHDVCIQDLSNTGSSVGALATLTIPVDVKVLAHITIYTNNAGTFSFTKVTSPAETNTVPSSTYLDIYTNVNAGTAQTERLVRSNTAGQIRYRTNVAVSQFWLNTIGWFDDRGRTL